MKVFGTVMKILAALAAIAGAVYVVATYGDKIVAWAKNLLGRCECCCDGECCCDEDCCEPTDEEADVLTAEEAAAEEPADEAAVQAEESDFEG